MSKMRSSSTAVLLGCALTAWAFAGCARQPQAGDSNVRGIGYVRVSQAVKSDPLYPQLAQIQDAIDALDVRALGAPPLTGKQIAQQTQELNRELKAAQTRADALLARKQADYARAEQSAVAAALKAAGAGTNGTQALTQMQGVAGAQAAAVNGAARSDLAAYQRAVIAQDNAALAQVERQLNDRANQSYRQKATQLSEQESQLALELSQQDAAKRLELRTKLNNLALDDATIASYRKQLAAIDAREGAIVNAQRARDARTLAAYRRQLQASTQAGMSAQARQINASTRAKIAAQQNAVVGQTSSQLPGLQPPPIPAGLPASTRTRLAQINTQYRSKFEADARATIAQYQATKSDLDAQYSALHAANATADGAAQKQIAGLRRQRDDLYAKMVAQVKQYAGTEAAKRGLTVVFMNVSAAAGGIDLTNDVEKDIESIHQ